MVTFLISLSVVESISKLKKQQERLQREAEEVRKRELFCYFRVHATYVALDTNADCIMIIIIIRLHTI